jgi:hypothetical protein
MRLAAPIIPPLLVLSLLVGAGERSEAAPVFTTSVLAGCNAPATAISHGAPSESISCDIGFASASGRVASGIGFVRSEAAASVSASGLTVSAYGQGATRFQDSFTVQALDAGGVSVISGFLTATIRVDAVATAGDFGFASVLWNHAVGTVGNNGRALATTAGQISTSGGTFDLVVPWNAGVALPITLFGNAEASGVMASGSTFGQADFMNSMYWLGISGVTDASGTPVASFTALSDQGVNYTLAMPEPGTAMLLGASLLVVAGTRRSARRRP